MERYRLYAASESPYCQSVKGQLLRLGVPHVTTLLDWEGLRTSDQVRTLNPKGQVPILVGPEGPVCDSLLITAMLELRHGSAPGAEGAQGAEGVGWLAGRDALLFRTADVELRDALMDLYRAVKRGARLRNEEGHAAREHLARACEMVGALLPRPHGSAPAETAGTLHAAFLLDAAIDLSHRAGLGSDADVRALHAGLASLPLVARVFEHLGARPRGGRP